MGQVALVPQSHIFLDSTLFGRHYPPCGHFEMLQEILISLHSKRIQSASRVHTHQSIVALPAL